MQIAFTADWHLDRANHKNTVPAAYAFQRSVLERQPDLVVFGGDLFDKRSHVDPTSLYVAQDVLTPILEAGISCAVIPGNHDAANAWREPSTVKAALEKLGAARLGLGSMTVFSAPGVVVLASKSGRQIVLGGLPCPSKYHLAASENTQSPDILGMLVNVLDGLAAQAKQLEQVGPVVLAFHGMVGGASLDNERLIVGGQQIAIPLDVIERGPWEVALAGDLHTPQQVGRVLYPGSIAPLTFAQVAHTPSFLMVTLRDRGPDVSHKSNGGGTPVTFERIPLPVTQPLLEVRVEDTEEGHENMDAITAVMGKLTTLAGDGIDNPLSGARVRVRVKAAAEALTNWNESQVRHEFPEVARWQFEIERLPAVRLRTTLSAWDGIAGLLEDWIVLNPAVEPIKAELIDYATKLEAELGGVSEPLSGADYIPLETSVKDFRQLGEATVVWPLLGRLTCIKGENYAGKSNLALAEGFALYGLKAFPGEVLRKMVRDGTREAVVIHDFMANDKTWRIRRTVKLSSSGKPTGDLVLAELLPDFVIAEQSLEVIAAWSGIGHHAASKAHGWVSANKADRGATEAEIERLAGPPAVFFSTRFARQNEISKLLTMGEADRLRLLQREVQADRFEAGYNRANTEAKELQNDFDKLGHRHTTAKDAAAGAEDLEALVERTKVKISGLETAKEETTQAIRDLEKTIRANREDQEAIKTEADKLKAAEEGAAEALGELKRLHGNRLMIEATTEDSVQVADKIERRSELRIEAKQLAELRVQTLEVEGELDKLIERYTGEVRSHERAIAATEGDIKHKERQAALLESVPCQGFDPGTGEKPVDDELRREVAQQTKGCQFLLDAVRASEDIPDLKIGLTELENTNPAAKHTLEKIEALRDRVKAIGFDAGVQDTLAKELGALEHQGLDAKALEIAGAEGRLEELDIKIEAATKTTNALKESVAAMADRKGELPGVLHSFQELGGRLLVSIHDFEESRDIADQDLRTHSQELGRAEAELSRATTAGFQLEELNTKLEEVRTELQVRQAYQAATGRMGIPFLLVERAIPELEGFANAILAGSGLVLMIEPMRDLESGKVKEGVALSFSDCNGTHPLTSTSGAQGNILGLALRAGVAWMSSRRSGMAVPMFLVDEGFGSYSKENLEHAQTILNRLADKFGRVVFITHIPEVQEVAETTITVTHGLKGSEVTID